MENNLALVVSKLIYHLTTCSIINLYIDEDNPKTDIIDYIRANYTIIEEDRGWSTKTQQWIQFKIEKDEIR